MKKLTFFLPLFVFVLSLVLVFLLATKSYACGGWFEESCSNGSQTTESKKQEDIQKRLVKSVPVPEVNNSTTREALARRTKLFDSQNKITYVYLVSFGRVMAFYTVKGQVVSLRSYLTPMENIVNSFGELCSLVGGCYGSQAGALGYTVSAPDVDGTYGENTDGIFFFTTEGAYVEWRGDYMVSDQPLKLTTQPELVREVK